MPVDKNRSKIKKVARLVILVIVVGYVAMLYYQGGNTSQKIYIQSSAIPTVPTTNAVPQAPITATKFITTPFSSPSIQWEKVKIPKPLDLTPLHKHKSYETWQASVIQQSGKPDNNKYYFDGVYDIYKRQFSQLNWAAQGIANGPSGSLDRFTGVIDNKAQEAFINFEARTASCDMGGCTCPCKYSYTVYISSIDSI
ncbi:MAG: hypothetical protein WCL07_00870 [bacterium]